MTTQQEFKKLPVFFIMGRPRSGTTLLSTLFDAHPRVKIPPEFPILLPLYQQFRKVKHWDEKTILRFVDFIFQHNVFIHRTLENLKIDREAFTNDLMKLIGKGTLQDFLIRVNYNGYSIFPKGDILCVGDKNPVYSIYMKRFMKIFPQAKFICIIRDYRDNYVSMKKLADLKLEAPVLSLQVYRWRYVAGLFLRCRKKDPARVTLIRYEDLVTRQHEILPELCKFVGIPYDPGVFDFYKKQEETQRAYNNPLIERFHGSLMKPVNTGRMEQYRKEMDREEIATADAIAGKYGRQFGYASQGRKRDRLRMVRALPMMAYGWLIFRLYVAGSFLPARLSLWLSVKLLVLVRTYSYFAGKLKPRRTAGGI